MTNEEGFCFCSLARTNEGTSALLFLIVSHSKGAEPVLSDTTSISRCGNLFGRTMGRESAGVRRSLPVPTIMCLVRNEKDPIFDGTSPIAGHLACCQAKNVCHGSDALRYHAFWGARL